MHFEKRVPPDNEVVRLASHSAALGQIQDVLEVGQREAVEANAQNTKHLPLPSSNE
jgi:hypothetical protein